MPIDKLVPRYINRDDDYLLVKSTEMIDALNVHVSDDKDGNAGVIKNAWGNTSIPFATGDGLTTGAGVNRVVGTVVNSQKGEVFFFVYNSDGDHSIYMYTTESGEAVLVYRDSVLGFTLDTFVIADCIVKENNDTLLYFTDGVNAPMKVNATKALLGGPYPYSSGYTDEEKLYSLTVCKAPPLSAPTFEYLHDSSVLYSNIKNRTYQFAYQYVYEDGEVSAISPYSTLAVNPLQKVDGYVSGDSLEYYNKLRVTVDTNKGDVAKIRLLTRQGGSTTFYVVGEEDNNRGASTLTFDFINDKNYNIVSNYDVLKMYDNVPLSANSLSIVANRLVFGGYTEFYDNHSVTAFKYPIHHTEGDISKVTTAPTAAANLSYNDGDIFLELAFGELPRLTNGTTEIVFDIYASAQSLRIINTAGNVPVGSDEAAFVALGEPELKVEVPVLLNPYTNFSNFASQITGALVNNYDVTVKPTRATYLETAEEHHLFGGRLVVNLGSAVVDTPNRKITFKLKVISAELKTSSASISAAGTVYALLPDSYVGFTLNSVDDTYTGTTWYGYKSNKYYSGTHFSAVSERSFKSNTNHKFGVVFYDDRNRSGAVNEIGETFVTAISNRESGKTGPTEMVIRLAGSPPSWAKKWQLVYAPKSSYSFIYQYSVAEAFFSKAVETSTDNRKIYLAMRHLEGKESSYKESKGAKFDYSFVEGDILRVIKYETGSLPNGSNQYPKDLSFKIIGYNYQSTPDDPIISSPHDEYRETGYFLEIEDGGVSGWSAADVDSGTDLWHHDVVIEIYRPRKETETTIYYEMGEVNDVLYDSNSFSYRYGGDRDYTYIWASGYGNITVSNGIATSSLDLREGDIISISSTWNSYSNVRLTNVIKTYSGVEFTMSEVANGSYALASISNLTDGVVQTFEGDVYYRPRRIKFNLNGDKTNKTGVYYEDFFVEDNSVSDFFTSEANSAGRPNAPASSVGQIYRASDISYSDPYALDSQVLTLSSFNLSGGNFASMQPSHGAIRYMVNNDDSITVLQERKASLVPVNKNIIEYSNGSAGPTISTNFIGPQSFYAGNYGVNKNPESVVSSFGRVYFADIRQGKILRLSNNGLEPISEQGVDSLFTTKCADAIALEEGNFRLTAGYDPVHSEYLITFEKYKGSGSYTNETIAFDTKTSVWNTRYSFIPEAYMDIDGSMYTFKYDSESERILWEHSEDVARNTFYGNQTAADYSMVKVVSSSNNSMVKTFEATSIEGNAPWSFTAQTSDQTATTVGSSILDKRERMYYSNIPKDTLISTGHIYPLGVVSDKTASTIDLTTKISDIPFPLGGSIYLLDSGSYVDTGLTVSAVGGRKYITFSGTPTQTINVGDEIAVYGDTNVDGDKLRDAYAVIEYKSTATTPIEAYAFNTYYNRSMLHNELVN
jgi:hypothetical protein